MAKLSAEQLNALPDEMFGLPKTRQYPMPDKEHVIKAIQFFKYCKDSDKPELAKNINRRAKELEMKIRVQPSSAFYKCADKSILKEAMMVQEFHIGQLAPIVTLEPQIIKMNFGNGKMEDTSGPMERLRKIWSSGKPLAAKTDETAKIVEDAIANESFQDDDSVVLRTLSGIEEMTYMQMSWTSDDGNATHAQRSYEWDMHLLNDSLMLAIQTHNISDIIAILKSINNGAIFALALKIMDYSALLSKQEKKYILSKFKELPNVFDDNTSKVPFIHSPMFGYNDKLEDPINNAIIPVNIRMNDEDIFHIDQFVNMIGSSSTHIAIYSMLYRIAKNKLQSDIISTPNTLTTSGDTPSLSSLDIKSQMVMTDFVNAFNNSYYRKTVNSGYCDFIRIDNRIYAANMYECKDSKNYIFMVCIYDYTNDEYSKNILSMFMGAKIDFNIITRTVEVSKAAALEATDFKDLYNGIQISKNGNVSFLLDELQPWQHKYDTCKLMLERNLKDKEYENYKNNLCALYSLINVIYNKYNPTLSDDSNEAKQALSTMDKSIELFRNSIESIGKIQPEFNFVDYYMSNHYNDKLTVFHGLDDKEVRDEATLSYGWIVSR